MNRKSEYNNGNYVNYTQLNLQTPDIQAHLEDNVIEDYPIIFNNCLPIDIALLIEKKWTNDSVFGGNILANGKLGLESHKNDKNLQDGDIIHFLHFVGDKTYGFVCPSHTFTKRVGEIFVGNVISYIGSFKRDLSSGWDVSSLVFHNLLKWPIVIFHKGYPVAAISANTFLGDKIHHNDLTISPSAYYDNQGLGIMMGSKFDVKFDDRYVKNLPNKVIYSFVVDDIDVNHIFIGGVGVQIDNHNSSGANPQIYLVSNTGRAIYRMGQTPAPFKPVMPGGITGGIPIRGKNSPGMDKHRTFLGRTGSIRSTIPTAHYKKLSGENVVCAPFI